MRLGGCWGRFKTLLLACLGRAPPMKVEARFMLALLGGSLLRVSGSTVEVIEGRELLTLSSYTAACDVALFVDRGVESASHSLLNGRCAFLSISFRFIAETDSFPPTSTAHIFFAFHGGSDDRACLALLVQLVARNPSLEATIVRVERAAEPTQDDRDEEQGLSTKANTRDGRSTSEEMSTPILFSQLTVQGGGATDTGE